MFKTLLFSVWLIFHPVHVTLTSIDYIPAMDSFKVFVRMYFDDFILDYRLNEKELENIDFSSDNSKSREIFERYIGEKIMIKVNKNELSGKLQDISLDDNEVSMNLEYKTEEKPRVITVKNIIMTGLYSDQANMIIVRINNFEEGIKLTSDLTEQTFKIK